MRLHGANGSGSRSAVTEPIHLVGLGTLSAFGHERQRVSERYAAALPALVVREILGEPTAVGALPPSSEAALEAFLAARPRYRQLDRTVVFATFCARRALDEARWDDSEPVGVVLGSSRGATGLLERYHGEFARSERGRVPTLTSPTTTLGNLSTWVAQEAMAHGAEPGPGTELSSTCSTASMAIGTAVAWLRGGLGRRFLCGGTETALTPFTVAQMKAVRVVSRIPEDPLPCRAAAADHSAGNTMVLGEGAGVLALERGEAAVGRSLARVRGVGFCVEPTTSGTSLSDDGVALQYSMRRALADAALETVDAIITHTPGTTKGDAGELAAIAAVFGTALPLLTSNKWLLGHTLGASGALSVEYAVHLLAAGPYARYPYAVPFAQPTEPAPIRSVLINSVGFGGNAASLILTAP